MHAIKYIIKSLFAKIIDAYGKSEHNFCYICSGNRASLEECKWFYCDLYQCAALNGTGNSLGFGSSCIRDFTCQRTQNSEKKQNETCLMILKMISIYYESLLLLWLLLIARACYAAWPLQRYTSSAPTSGCCCCFFFLGWLKHVTNVHNPSIHMHTSQLPMASMLTFSFSNCFLWHYFFIALSVRTSWTVVQSNAYISNISFSFHLWMNRALIYAESVSSINTNADFYCRFSSKIH